MSNELNTILIEAENIANNNSDQFITEEHLFLSIIKNSDSN
ncbi:hypothetical protein HOF65_04850, partial [bacterium]|nr:hypothetical protein [bacterium]